MRRDAFLAGRGLAAQNALSCPMASHRLLPVLSTGLWAVQGYEGGEGGMCCGSSWVSGGSRWCQSSRLQHSSLTPEVSKGLSFSEVREDFPSQGLDIEMRLSGFKRDLEPGPGKEAASQRNSHPFLPPGPI